MCCFGQSSYVRSNKRRKTPKVASDSLDNVKIGLHCSKQNRLRQTLVHGLGVTRFRVKEKVRTLFRENTKFAVN